MRETGLVFYSGEQEFRCSFSAGIATYPQYQSLETLRQAADDALYRAKYQGRNETLWEHQGEALIGWGYDAAEMRCRVSR